jgi:hypothetical protein
MLKSINPKIQTNFFFRKLKGKDFFISFTVKWTNSDTTFFINYFNRPQAASAISRYVLGRYF